jgi:hypothetical protein
MNRERFCRAKLRGLLPQPIFFIALRAFRMWRETIKLGILRRLGVFKPWSSLGVAVSSQPARKLTPMSGRP